MKVRIVDAGVLKALSPTSVAACLRVYGWDERDASRAGTSEWAKVVSDEEILLVCPLKMDAKDYALRMSEVLEDLSDAEGIPQDEVLRDIQTSTADLIRFRVKASGAEDGSLPLEDGERLITGAKEVMLSAACAALEPKPYYATRKPNLAMDYLSRVRLGQSEVGSYILTVHSTIPPEVTGGQQNMFHLEQPFERRVSLTLAAALKTTQAVAVRNSVDTLKDVASGLSANMCSALATMSGQARAHSLEVAIKWAAVRSAPAQVANRFSFSADQLGILGEAGRTLKASAQLEGAQVTGLVVVLKRDAPVEPGKVTIKGLVDGELRTIRVQLSADDYKKALEAHGHGLTVMVTGEIQRRGNVSELINPRGFSVESEEAPNDEQASG